MGGEETFVARLRAIQALGVSKAILMGATSGVDVAEARRAGAFLAQGVLPGFAPSD